jgi:hypothetical protein
MTGAQKTGASALTTGAKPLPTGASPAAAAAAPEAPAAPAIPPEAQMPPARNMEAFNRLCLASEGVIYQDEFLQIGLRSVYQTQFGRLMLYYGKLLSDFHSDIRSFLISLSLLQATPPRFPSATSTSSSLRTAVWPCRHRLLPRRLALGSRCNRRWWSLAARSLSGRPTSWSLMCKCLSISVFISLLSLSLFRSRRLSPSLSLTSLSPSLIFSK